MRIFLCGLVLVVLACGCTQEELVDPTGTWNMTINWLDGNCGLTGSSDAPLTITRGSDGYFINEPDPNVVVDGTVLCTSSHCELSMIQTTSGTLPDGLTFTANTSANLKLNVDGTIFGSGTIAFSYSDGNACMQQFSSQGHLT